jgi:membrane fusion protein (multidrug efflux system)
MNSSNSRWRLGAVVGLIVVVVFLGRWWLTSGSKVREEANRAIPVVTAPARVGPVVETYGAIGTASANEAVMITSKVTGIVRTIEFNEGELVPAGKILVELENRELKANLSAAEADVRNAKQTYDRTVKLAAGQNAPQARVEELQAALQSAQARADATGARLADMTIAAPFAGRLGLRRISLGTLIQAGTVITTLDDASIIKMDFSVPETLLSSMSPGQSIEAVTGAYPDRRFVGTVRTIDSRIDPTTRAFAVRAEIPNDDGVLKPGMLLTLQLALARRESAILIPEEALVPQGDKQFVYVVEDGKARRKEVEIGTRTKGTVEIRSGIEPTAVVLIGGTQRVRDGTPVRTPDQEGQGRGQNQGRDKNAAPAS